MLARAEPRDRVLVRGVAGQVIAAESLDGDDRAGAERRDALLERNREPWPADRARDRLRVEAPVGRILVLAPALGTQRKAGHRRARPVVRDVDDDREARPALRAVDERVAVAAIGRVEELGEAVVAGRDVGRDQRTATGALARDDPELAFARRRQRCGRDGLDAGQNRSLVPQPGRERVERPAVALRLDDDARAVVEHEAAERVPTRQPVHERPVADSLDDTGNAEAPPFDSHARTLSMTGYLHVCTTPLQG